jgi:preprotein translocase subunit SecG
VVNRLKKNSHEASPLLNDRRGRAIPVAVLLIFVVLLSMGSGIYASASFFAQQAPNVTVTTTIYTTTTSWTTSTIWSTVTQVVQGVLTTIDYTTSTSTVTVTGIPTSNYGDTNIESLARGAPASYVFAATRFTSGSAVTITQLALYFYVSPSGNIKFAVYRDSGGIPAGQSLVGQTSEYAIGAGTGWHTYTLSSDVIYISSSGTYWLCFLLSSDNRANFRSKATGSNYIFPQPYASGFPATFPAQSGAIPTSLPYGDFSFYATGSP